MTRQYRVPGQGLLNETLTGQYRAAGAGFVNETDASGAAGSAAGTSTVSAVGVTAAVGTGTSAGASTVTGIAPSSSSAATAAGTSMVSGTGASVARSSGTAAGGSSASATPLVVAAHSDVTSYRLPGHGALNETTTRQYRIPGGAFVNETQITGYSGTATGTSTASAIGAALAQGTALSTGGSSASAVGASLDSGTGTASGTSSATGDGTSIISRPVVCFSPGDYFNYISLDRRADKSVGSGSASGTSTATGIGAAVTTSTGSAAGASTATGETSGSVASSSGTAAGTSTVVGAGTSEAPYELVVIGSPKVGYSLIKPRGYSGTAGIVTRESDGQPLEIGYKPNGVADQESADAFAPLGWRWSTWFDFTGNGYHLTVPAGVQAPKNFGNTIAGLRSLTFNGPQTQQALANLSVNWTDVRNVTIMAVIKTAAQGIFEIGNPTRKMSLLGSTDSGINWSGIQGQYAVTSPQVLLVTGNGAANRVLKQNHRVTTASAQTSSAATGLTVGNAIGYTGPGNVDFLCFVGYDSTLSPADQTALTDAAFSAVPTIPRAARDVIAVHGDSLIQGNSRGAGVSVETIWFSRLMAATTRAFTWYNCGHGGFTAGNLAGVAPTVAAACYDPLGTNSVIFAAGSNDLAFGATAAQAYANIVAACDAWYAAGFARVHVVDVIPRKAIFTNGVTAASFEAQRQLLLPMIAAGVGADFDSASSPGTHPVIGDPANCNATYFSDLVHLNPLGNQIAADLIDADTAPWRT